MIERKAYYVLPGSFKNLKTRNEELPAPQPSEVQVEVKAIGLNFADVFCLLGLYEAAPKHAFIPGLEFSGIVTSAGENVKNFKTGDRVMGVTRFGAYCTDINIDASYVIPLPVDWSFVEGSAYLVQVLTAYYGLVELGNIKNNQNVLIHSAAGGVGLWANRICKHFNCFTIGTVGNRSKVDLLKTEGYDRCIVREKKKFRHQLAEALDSRPLHLVMESIGGTIFEDSFEALAPMGRVIAFGSAHYGERKDRPNYLKLVWKYLRRPMIDPQNMIGENKSVMGFNLIYLFDHADLMHDILKSLRQMNLGKPFIGKTYGYEELPDALREFQSGKTTGKLVVTV
jgi:alcohol dehydrogenase